MRYKVEYTSKARKDLKKLPLEIAQSIIRSINRIKDDPHPHIKKIKGTQKNPLYTHRVGEYRAILYIEDERLLILVIEARSKEKDLPEILRILGKAVVDEIQQATPEGHIQFWKADLSLISEVWRISKLFLSQFKHLDSAIGIIGETRIIDFATPGQNYGEIDFSDISMERNYSAMNALKRGSFCNNLMAVEYSKRANNKQVTFKYPRNQFLHNFGLGLQSLLSVFLL